MSAILAFVQARMSSRRFPGKVLAPFKGVPIIRHVVERVARALPSVPVSVLTSDQPSDDPLAAYVATELAVGGVRCFRGPLDDVFARFCGAVRDQPCDWVLRVCADSPLIDEQMLRAVVGRADEGVDLVTTTLRRTFPRGSNAELIRVSALLAVERGPLPDQLTTHDREHVTPFFHRHRNRFNVVNVESSDPAHAELNLAVDTIEDLRRLEEAP